MRSAIPKVLHPVAGRPLVEHAVRAAAGLDPRHLAVVVGHGREAVNAHLQAVAAVLGRAIDAPVQSEQRGTGHAVSCALDVLPADLAGTVLVSYGDVPLLDTATLAGLLEAHRRAYHAVTVLSVHVADPTGYGRIERDVDGEVTGIVEHRDATEAQHGITEINSGVYAFDAAVLRSALGRLGTANSQDVVRDGLVGGHPDCDCPQLRHHRASFLCWARRSFFDGGGQPRPLRRTTAMMSASRDAGCLV